MRGNDRGNRRLSDKLIIRRAGPADQKALVELLLSCFPEIFTEQKARKRTEEACILVAELENRVVGFVDIECEKEIGVVWGLGVAEDFRRQGIGKRLLREAIKELKRMGAKRIYLYVRKSHELAKKLYRSEGFEYERTTRFSVRGEPLELWVLKI